MRGTIVAPGQLLEELIGLRSVAASSRMRLIERGVDAEGALGVIEALYLAIDSELDWRRARAGAEAER